MIFRSEDARFSSKAIIIYLSSKDAKDASHDARALEPVRDLRY